MTKGRVRRKVREKFEKSSEKTADRILGLLEESSDWTIDRLAKEIGLSTRAIEKQLQRLQSEGRLRRVGPAKGGHWQVPGRK